MNKFGDQNVVQFFGIFYTVRLASYGWSFLKKFTMRSVNHRVDPPSFAYLEDEDYAAFCSDASNDCLCSDWRRHGQGNDGRHDDGRHDDGRHDETKTQIFEKQIGRNGGHDEPKR